MKLVRNLLTLALQVSVAIAASAGAAGAGPTNLVWIPSVDVQAFKTLHLGIDNYFRASGAKDAPPNELASRDANTMDIGLTVGVLPFEKLHLEVGCDYLATANDPNDQHPWSGNIKLATPEDALFAFSPAVAVGLYNARPVKDVATADAPKVSSGQNIVYGLVAKTVPALGALPSLGRFSAGYYRGSERALVNTRGGVANDGVLLSWDRTLKEISERLWLGVDYMGGDNVNSSFNAGISWAFARNVTVLFGYDLYTKKSLAGSNTFVTQVDIDFP
jgi:hypothetical protein